jgi:hypothetical protein
MPHHLIHALLSLALVVAPIAATRGDEGKLPSPKKLVIQFWVVEVSSDKMQKLGFDWAQLTPDGAKKTPIDQAGLIFDDPPNSVEQFLGFLKALEQNDLARTLCRPTLITLDGRPASLAIGDYLELDIVPVTLGDSSVRLEYRLKISSSETRQDANKEQPQANRKSISVRMDAAAELDLGKTFLVSHTRVDRRADEVAKPTEMLVLARVDLWNTDAHRVIERPATTSELRAAPRKP